MSDRERLHALLGEGEGERLLGALRRGLTRRELLGLLLKGGMLAAAAGSTAGLALSAHAQTPRRGGRLRVASAAASIADTLDPAKQANYTDYLRGCMLHNGLTTLDGRLAPQPELAEWFDSADARSWVFRLREGVLFHNGKALAPEDVVFSLLRHKDPATASKARVLAEQIDSVRATGPREVTVTLKQPNADLPVILGTHHFHIVPAGTTDFSAGIGTGPFRLKEFKRGLRSVVVRNERYWKPGRPYLDEIELSGLGDESARVNALLSGDLDLVGGVNPRSVARIKATAGYDVFVTRSGQYTDLDIRQDLGPGASPDFVLAMKYLFDRPRMRDAVALGYAELGNDQPIDPSHRFYFPGLPQRAYDPERARYHFRKSGLGNTVVPVVASPVAIYSVEMALMLQQAADGIGLKLDVKRMPADGYWSTYWMKSPIAFGNVNARPSADILFTQFFKSDGPWNASRWRNPHFDQLLLLARSESDEARRQQYYADMQTLIHDGAGVGIPMFLSSLDGHTTRLKGLSPVPLGGMMGAAFAEHVWLED
ncbi:ABC transporter substrate-binding protein [Frateuria defendens]|uniref:ABC transporter substrate-binding protein n=1 Tax=Frateuria defendens TaxID=2219559 RepID=UPI00066FC95F|nr:ABC transporter substrate-binding protein [Frateuria defendens]